MKIKNITTKSILLGALIILPFTANAAMYLIDPDDFPVGSTICDMGGIACVNTTLSEENAFNGDGKIYSWTDTTDAANRVFGSKEFVNFSTFGTETFIAEFADDVDFVSLKFISNSVSDFGKLTVYLDDMTSIDLITGDLDAGESQTLSHTALGGTLITKIEAFSTNGPSDILIDELRFNIVDREPNPANAARGFLLFSIALGGILLKRRAS